MIIIVPTSLYNAMVLYELVDSYMILTIFTVRPGALVTSKPANIF